MIVTVIANVITPLQFIVTKLIKERELLLLENKGQIERNR
jgi:hypothetical protein